MNGFKRALRAVAANPYLLLPVVVTTMVWLSLKFEPNYWVVLAELGCQAVQVAGIQPQPMQHGLCSIQGTANWRIRNVEISDVVINRDFVVANKKVERRR